MKIVIDRTNNQFIYNIETGLLAVYMVNIECVNVSTIIIEPSAADPFERFELYQLQLLRKNATGGFPTGDRESIIDDLITICYMLPKTAYNPILLKSQSDYCNTQGTKAFEYENTKHRPTLQAADWVPYGMQVVF